MLSFFLIGTTIIILTFLVLSITTVKSQRQYEEQLKTSYDGKKYTGLNDVLEFEDHSTYRLYEIIDFEATINDEEDDLRFRQQCDPETGEPMNVIRLIEATKGPQDKVERIIMNVLPSEALTDEELQTLSDTIREGRRYAREKEEQEEELRLYERYKSKNMTQERLRKMGDSTSSMEDFQEKLDEDKAELDRKLEEARQGVLSFARKKNDDTEE